jgi:hypothetical protein
MINILFLAFEFPPLNRGGVHRSLAFVKWLPQFGINPIVVTLDRSSYPDVFDEFGQDESLGNETKKDAVILPLKSRKPPPQSKVKEFVSIYFSIYGNEVNYWKQNYFDALPGIIEKYKPSVVFATAPPFSIFPLAWHTSKIYGLPMVLDFRDAWSQWRTLPFGTRLHYWANLLFERRYLARANAVIVTSEQTLTDFKRLHPGIPASKFHYIPNGFEGSIEKWLPLDINKSEFIIGYVGSFYYSPHARDQMLTPWWKKRGHRMLQYIPQRQDWLYRSPFFFLKALQFLNSSNPHLARRIKVHIVGKPHKWLTEMIEKFGNSVQVELMGTKSHQEALEFQMKCDLLLITSAKRIGGRDYSVAGKTFEYIKVQKPILAFVSEGAQKDLLEKSGQALLCDPDEVKESARIIEELLTGNKVMRPDSRFIETLSREKLSGELARIIKQLIKK